MIVEVETPESKDDWRAQRQERAFAGAAKRSPTTRFERVITDRSGKDVVRPATAAQIRRDVKVTARDLRAARKGVSKTARKR